MLKSILRLTAVAFLSAAIVLTLLQFSATKQRITPEDIMESVVIVNGSSGVVVESDDEKALVITSYHVINDEVENKQPILVAYLYYYKGTIQLDKYTVESIAVDVKDDLALLEIHPGRSLFFSDIASTYEDPRLGDDFFIGSNPNHKYRSLKKGIISSKQRYLDDDLTWEVSGGIIFGSSGGGAFTTDGKLFGIVRAVDPLKYKCWETDDEPGCLYLPIYHMGFIVPPEIVRSFILNSKYKDDFNYLRKN